MGTVSSTYADYLRAEDKAFESFDTLESDSTIRLGMFFRGPICGLLIGITISLIVFVLEHIFYIFVKLLKNNGYL